MSKFCMQCGAQIDDNAANCPSCGAVQNNIADPQPANPNPAPGANVNTGASETNVNQGTASVSMPKIDIDQIKNMDPEKKKKALIITAGALAVLIILIVLRVVFSAGAYKKPLSNYEDAINSGKGKYIYKVIPDFIMDSVFDDYKKSEIIEEFDDILEEKLDYYEDEYGDDFKYELEIVDKDSVSNRQLKSLEKSIKYTYGEKVDVSKGYEVTVREKYKGDDSGSRKNTSTFYVYKVDGEWYCPSVLDSFISDSYWDYDYDYDYDDVIDDLEDIFG
ncbi:MAG: zinc-ribbon domain-containing protein [Porcipelethomonas sp.]